MKKRVLTTLSGALLALLVIACSTGESSSSRSRSGGGDTPATTSNAPEQPKNVTVKIGESADIEWGNGSKSTILVAELATAKSGRFGAAENGQFITVKITITQVAGGYHANPFNFKLVVADGGAFNHTLSLKEPDLNATDLSADGVTKVSGYISFDVPTTAQQGGQIVVEETGLSSGYAARWALS